MPTYEYKCFACNHTFERFQSITADPIKRCPECGKAKVKRLLGTGAGFVFKGSGFYITDYRDQGYKDKAKAESGAGGDADGAKSDGAKTDGATAKPDAPATSTDATKSAAPAESKPAVAEKPKSKRSPK